MKVGVLGGEGFIGSEIVRILKKKHEVTVLTRINYDYLLGKSFDVFINAGGSSRKYLAEVDALADFNKNVLEVYKSVLDFGFEKYIYISTTDVYGSTTYGFHKRLAENILRERCKNLVILRCSAVIGKGMKKGFDYDLLKGIPLYVSNDSKFQLITNTAIAKFIDEAVENSNIWGGYNLAGITQITVREVVEILGVSPRYNENAKKQEHNVDTELTETIFKLKTSKKYLKDIL